MADLEIAYDIPDIATYKMLLGAIHAHLTPPLDREVLIPTSVTLWNLREALGERIQLIDLEPHKRYNSNFFKDMNFSRIDAGYFAVDLRLYPFRNKASDELITFDELTHREKVALSDDVYRERYLVKTLPGYTNNFNIMFYGELVSSSLLHGTRKPPMQVIITSDHGRRTTESRIKMVLRAYQQRGEPGLAEGLELLKDEGLIDDNKILELRSALAKDGGLERLLKQEALMERAVSFKNTASLLRTLGFLRKAYR